MTEPLLKLPTTDAEWRLRLSPDEFRVLRLAGTEAPWSGEYVETKTEGTYHCRACGAQLFDSDTKFDSGSGWPSFYDVKNSKNVKLIDDNTLGMHRVEVECAVCGSHLGHVFNDAYDQPTGRRFCINSAALDFMPKDSDKKVPGV